MFYTYHQSNPNGRFIENEKIGHYVIIEARDCVEADMRADDIGISVDDDYRWDPAHDGKEIPTIYGQPVEKYVKTTVFDLEDNGTVHIYYKNGKHKKVKIDVKKNKAEKRRKAKKTWATCFNLMGVYSRKPVRMYYDKEMDNYWDATGNFGVEKIGLGGTDGRITFASDSKAEVQQFIDGAIKAINIAMLAVENVQGNTKQEEFGVKAVFNWLKNKS